MHETTIAPRVPPRGPGAADQALRGIYDSGLAAIHARFARPAGG